MMYYHINKGGILIKRTYRYYRILCMIGDFSGTPSKKFINMKSYLNPDFA